MVGRQLDEQVSRRATWRWLGRLAGFAVLLALFFFLDFRFVIASYTVGGDSMAPALESGQHIVVDKLAYLFSQPGRGDMVVFGPTPDDTELLGHHRYLKRIVATAGDRISCCDQQGRIDLNGDALQEPYRLGPNMPFPPVRIPAHAVFLLGDNRPYSSDSRLYGPVAAGHVVGKVIDPRGRTARLMLFAVPLSAALLGTVIIELVGRGLTRKRRASRARRQSPRITEQAE